MAARGIDVRDYLVDDDPMSYPSPHDPSQQYQLPAVPPPYPQSPPPYPPPIVIAMPPTSGMAVASMVMGIIGLLGGWCAFGLPCLLAVVLGHAAWNETKSGAKSGHGMAVAGLVMGYIVVLPALLISVLFVFTGVLGVGASTQ